MPFAWVGGVLVLGGRIHPRNDSNNLGAAYRQRLRPGYREGYNVNVQTKRLVQLLAQPHHLEDGWDRRLKLHQEIDVGGLRGLASRMTRTRPRV